MPTILIVEKDSGHRSMIASRLQANGWDTIGISDESEILDVEVDFIVVGPGLSDRGRASVSLSLESYADAGGIPLIRLAVPEAVAPSFEGKNREELGHRDSEAVQLAVEVALCLPTGLELEREVLRVGPFFLDPAEGRAEIHGESVELTGIEFHLLRHLIGNAGAPQSREDLLHSVWGYRNWQSTRTVDTTVARLRAKLGEFGHFIQTVRTCGYVFQEPP